MLIKDNSIYYIDEYKDKDKLYRYNILSDYLEKIVDRDIKFYYVSDKYIYYVLLYKFRNKKALFRCDLDGNNDELLVDDDVKDFDIFENKNELYYINDNPDGLEGMYIVNLKTLEVTQLFEETPYNYLIVDDYIYYGDIDNQCLVRSRKGEKKVDIVTDLTTVINFVDGDWIYVTNEEDGSLYRLREGNEGFQRLTDLFVIHYNRYKDSIVYWAKEDILDESPAKLYIMSKDGSNNRYLTEGIYETIIFDEGNVFCSTYATEGNGEIIKISIEDGKTKVIKNVNGWLDDVVRGYLYLNFYGDRIEGNFFEHQLWRMRLDGTQEEHIFTMASYRDV